VSDPPLEPLAALESALLPLLEQQAPALLDRIEATVFRVAYEYSERNQLRTARLLGTSRNVVRARLLQHGLLASPAVEVASPSSADVRRPLSDAREAGIPVRIGHQSFGVLSLLKATRALDDVFASRAARVEWSKHVAGMQIMDGLAVGALDLGLVGEAPPVFAQAEYAPLVYLAAEPPAPQGEGLVVLDRSPVRQVADLAGKAIAVARGSNALYFVVRALEECGLDIQDVHLRQVAPADGHRALLESEVDAWAIWDPLLASVRQTTKVRVLRDARGLVSNRAFYVARRAFADARPDLIDAFLGQLKALGRWVTENRRAAADALAPEADLPADVLELALAATPFDLAPVDAAAMGSQQAIAETLYRVGLINRSVRIADALWVPPAPARRSA
jgi:sulfonate transport system substrate-binding protein